MDNRCPVKGCDQTVAAGQPVCNRCWRRVPSALRDDVFESWKAKHAIRLANSLHEAMAWLREHPAACDAAEPSEGHHVGLD